MPDSKVKPTHLVTPGTTNEEELQTQQGPYFSEGFLTNKVLFFPKHALFKLSAMTSTHAYIREQFH